MTDTNKITNRPAWPRRLIMICLLPTVLAACSKAEIEAKFVPESDLWERWTAHDASSQARIDHTAWDRVLRAYLVQEPSGLNRFAYQRVTPADRMTLDGYIDGLTKLQISRYNMTEQLAYWVNLYNALTVQLVLDNYPVKSIRDINDGLLSPGPWNRKLVTIEGAKISLNDIESRILRPIWKDPRIHYAVNCASVGCPNLRRTAFTADNADSLLNSGARDYINNPRGVALHGDALIVSSIYIWFQGDFGGSEPAVLAHLTRYARPELATKIKDAGAIDGYRYDWTLNQAE